ncbi:ribosomal protein S6 kinase delta-1 [Biomphalaria glabrata]|nr:ribosomal protein S6 kinase delta-1-like [Biomphalaria glabrata]
MAHDNKWSVHDNVWNFLVTDPQLHRKGYTIYKVTCQTFPIKSPETLTEFVCWKRYNDFKTLHKALLALHKALHRKDQFPDFAKPKLFGRFDNNVIEERRLSAVELLHFVATQPHLYKSLVFKQFLEDGKSKSDPLKKGSIMTPLPSNLDIIHSGHKSDGNPPPDIVPVVTSKDDKATAALVKGHSLDIGPPAVQTEPKISPNNSTRPAFLEGTWNFPQVADNISLDSSTGDETLDTDEDSILASSLPDTDLAFFDPVGHESSLTSPDEVDALSQSNSWLLASLNMCAQLSDFEQNSEVDVKEECGTVDRADTMVSTDSTLTNHSIPSSSTLEKLSDLSDIDSSRKSSLTTGGRTDLDQFDPIRRDSQSSDVSKVECGKGDLDLSVEWQTRSPSIVAVGSQKPANEENKLQDDPPRSHSTKSSRSHSVNSDKSVESERGSSNKSTPSHTSRSLLKRLVTGSPKKPRSMSDQSVTTMDLGGKEDYIYLAASQISMAQNSEANGEFEVAFAYYKSGVGILLQGVQGDTNKARRDAVRRKTAQYLMKAEDLFSKHLATENVDERRWGADSFLSPSLDLDPSFAFIRGSVRELQNYQVLGTIDKVILVRDKCTDETFVFKSIPKTNTEGPRTPSILPTSCPHMVSLHKFYETDDSIFLLLQYASGGKLWAYIGDYLNCDKGNQGTVDLQLHIIKPEVTNVYTGTKVEANVVGQVGTHHKDTGPEATKYLKSSTDVTSPDDLEVIRFSTLTRKVSLTNVERNSHSFSCHEQEVDSFLSEVPSELTEDISAQKKQLPLNRRFSSLSDDCAPISETDSSVISPTTMLEEDHFQSYLQEYRSNVEGFSITSFDSEDTQRHSLSFRDKIDSIPEDSVSVPLKLTPRQISADEVFQLTRKESENVACGSKVRHLSTDGIFPSVLPPSAFNSSDIIRNSKELLQKVDRVLSESDDGSHKSGTVNADTALSRESTVDNAAETGAILVVEQQDSSFSESTEEPSIYDVNRSSEEDISDHNSNSTSENVANGKLVEESAQDLSAIDKSLHCDELNGDVVKEILETDTNSNSVFIVSDSEFNGQANVGRPGPLIRQTSTPHKLILSRMNSKDITRSASFECDLKSPTRNRARTVTDMFERLDNTNTEGVHIPETSVKKWMAQLVTAVSRLHSLGIICRDLKPSNVLLGEGGQVYLSYFCHLGQGECDLDWEAVHSLYAAPEVRSITGYDKSCDWWSIGALLYELLVGRTLSECHPGGINSHTYLYVPSYVSTEAKGLLEGLLKHNPHERLGSGLAGSEEIKAHPFFTGVDWHALEYS